MKVKELMEILKDFDPDAEVYMSGDSSDHCISDVLKDKHGDCELT